MINKYTYDEIIIGAGLSAMGYLIGAKDHKLNRLCITGDYAASETFPKKANLYNLNGFKLPIVRAFGVGGSSKVWHGVLFEPHHQDMYDHCYYGKKDSLSYLVNGLTGLSQVFKSIDYGVLYHRLHNVLSRLELSNGDSKARTVWVPKLQQDYTVYMSKLFSLSNCASSDMVVLSLEYIRGQWEVWGIDQTGFKIIHSKKVVLASGALTSLGLIAESNISFSDHSHCFCGILDSKTLLSVYPNISTKTADDVSRPFWKTTVEVLGMKSDVSLSFRKVSNFSFGQSFSDFVAFNSLNKWKKLSLLTSNPMEALSLALYRYGYNLPWGDYVVHATIATSEEAGTISQESVRYSPNKQFIANAARNALSEFFTRYGLDSSPKCLIFDNQQIEDLIMSGAQFLASSESYASVRNFTETYRESALVVDTSAFGFTSVHNQGLLSMVTGYKLAQDFLK